MVGNLLSHVVEAHRDFASLRGGFYVIALFLAALLLVVILVMILLGLFMLWEEHSRGSSPPF